MSPFSPFSEERNKKRIDAFKERAGWVSVGLGLRGLAVTLTRAGKKDPWLGRALKELDGIYRFESGNGKFYHYLVFGGGRVKLPRNWEGPPDFTFTLHEPPASYFRTRQEDVLELVFSNKVAQMGNTYYLSQFGFILSLLRRHFKNKGDRR